MLKPSSTTTKLRVVFDASAKTTNGVSLNDVLHTGPVIQDDLCSILLRFRKHNYVVTGDLTKMYRQIKIQQEQTHLQRIVWRTDPDNEIEHYALNTLTYGTAPASFLSTRCLKQLSIENKQSYPAAARAIEEDFYMDDLLTGSNSIENAIKLADDIISILHKGKFELRKFNSNSNEIIKSRFANDVCLIETKTLGIIWKAEIDQFAYAVDLDVKNKRITKRTILSITSQIFDTLGLFGPIIIRAKILLQKLWLLKMSWDETVPPDIHNESFTLFDDLKIVNKISVPRHVLVLDSVHVQIHGFCDASSLAYGACVYVRSIDSKGKIIVRLLTAKSRVAFITIKGNIYSST